MTIKLYIIVELLSAYTLCCLLGLFKIVPEQMPYSSIDEMMKLRPIGVDSSLPFTFTVHTKITIGDFTLGPGRALTVKSIERGEGEEEYIRCHVQGQQDTSAEVQIPLSTRGEFYECESEECFSLQEIMSSTCLRSRRFRFINTAKCQEPLLLSPVYQIHAIMNCKQPTCFNYTYTVNRLYSMISSTIDLLYFIHFKDSYRPGPKFG